MASSKTFVVAGATGWQGGATARHLKKAGHRVLGVTHTRSKTTKLEDMGIEPVVADLRDSATLIPHLKGADGFYLVTDPFATRGETQEVASWVEDEIRQGREALRAAHSAGIPHVVLSSVTILALEQGLRIHKSKIPIEKEAGELGLACTILRPPFFMDGWIWRAYDKSPQEWLQSGRIQWSVKPDTPIPHIATDDIGRVAAWSFDHPDRSAGQIWELVGEVTTFPAIAQSLSRRRGRPIVFAETPPAPNDFPPNPGLVRRDYVWDASTWESRFGFQMTTFEQYLRGLAAIP